MLKKVIHNIQGVISYMIKPVFQNIALVSGLVSLLALTACGGSDSTSRSDTLRRSREQLETDRQSPPTLPSPSPSEGVLCNRTPEVIEALLTELKKNNCSQVTAEHLNTIQVLNLNNKNIKSLKNGDFDGFTSLEQLYLDDNELFTLPSGVFNELSSLFHLSLSNNQLKFLPSNVFNGLSKLHSLSLHTNQFPSLPVNLFDGLTTLSDLYLQNNQLTSLPDNIFDRLTALTRLSLENNQLSETRKQRIQQKLNNRLSYLSL